MAFDTYARHGASRRATCLTRPSQSRTTRTLKFAAGARNHWENLDVRRGTDLETFPFVSQEKTSTMMQRKQLEEIAATVKGVPVWGCLPGSTAAEAGVRYGDIVLAVNG